MSTPPFCSVPSELARESPALLTLVTEPALARSQGLTDRRSAQAMDWSGLITRRTSAGGFPAAQVPVQHQTSACTACSQRPRGDASEKWSFSGNDMTPQLFATLVAAVQRHNCAELTQDCDYVLAECAPGTSSIEFMLCCSRPSL